MANEMDALIEIRTDLAAATDSDGAFPGSRKWLAASKAMAALAAFDAEHPQVIAHIRAAHAAKMASRYQD